MRLLPMTGSFLRPGRVTLPSISSALRAPHRRPLPGMDALRVRMFRSAGDYFRKKGSQQPPPSAVTWQ